MPPHSYRTGLVTLPIPYRDPAWLCQYQDFRYFKLQTIKSPRIDILRSHISQNNHFNQIVLVTICVPMSMLSVSLRSLTRLILTKVFLRNYLPRLSLLNDENVIRVCTLRKFQHWLSVTFDWFKFSCSLPYFFKAVDVKLQFSEPRQVPSVWQLVCIYRFSCLFCMPFSI